MCPPEGTVQESAAPAAAPSPFIQSGTSNLVQTAHSSRQGPSDPQAGNTCLPAFEGQHTQVLGLPQEVGGHGPLPTPTTAPRLGSQPATIVGSHPPTAAPSHPSTSLPPCSLELPALHPGLLHPHPTRLAAAHAALPLHLSALSSMPLLPTLLYPPNPEAQVPPPTAPLNMAWWPPAGPLAPFNPEALGAEHTQLPATSQYALLRHELPRTGVQQQLMLLQMGSLQAILPQQLQQHQQEQRQELQQPQLQQQLQSQPQQNQQHGSTSKAATAQGSKKGLVGSADSESQASNKKCKRGSAPLPNMLHQMEGSGNLSPTRQQQQQQQCKASSVLPLPGWSNRRARSCLPQKPLRGLPLLTPPWKPDLELASLWTHSSKSHRHSKDAPSIGVGRKKRHCLDSRAVSSPLGRGGRTAWAAMAVDTEVGAGGVVEHGSPQEFGVTKQRQRQQQQQQQQLAVRVDREASADGAHAAAAAAVGVYEVAPGLPSLLQAAEGLGAPEMPSQPVAGVCKNEEEGASQQGEGGGYMQGGRRCSERAQKRMLSHTQGQEGSDDGGGVLQGLSGAGTSAEPESQRGRVQGRGRGTELMGRGGSLEASLGGGGGSPNGEEEEEVEGWGTDQSCQSPQSVPWTKEQGDALVRCVFSCKCWCEGKCLQSGRIDAQLKVDVDYGSTGIIIKCALY